MSLFKKIIAKTFGKKIGLALGGGAARAILPQIKKECGWRRKPADVGRTA
jgi:hypothetical protein